MTISQHFAEATNKLKAKTKNPYLEAEILLSYVFKKPREYLLAHPEKKLTKIQITNYKLLITKRLKGVPTAYLAGYKHFHGLKFLVNKHVLIPRPETEMMVDEALYVTHNVKRVTIIDIGTGSGCIIITLANLLNVKSKIFPPEADSPRAENLKFYATDISKPALAVARKNAKLHKVDKKIKFLQGTLLEPIIKYKNKLKIVNCKLIICANLPYLTPTQIKKSSSIRYEPKLALGAGKDGLEYYLELFTQIKKETKSLRHRDLVSMLILCEIDPSQKSKIKQIIKKELPKARVQIKKDLRDLDRLAIIKFNN